VGEVMVVRKKERKLPSQDGNYSISDTYLTAREREREADDDDDDQSIIA